MYPALSKIIHLFISLLIIGGVNAQTAYDSIRSLLPNHPDSAYVLGLQWNQELDESKEDSIIGKSYYLLGLSSYYKSEFLLAEDFFSKAIHLFDSSQNVSFIEACHNNIGICRELSGRLDEAIESYLLSRDIAEKMGDSMGMMQTNINIGLLNLKINKIEDGKAILRDAKLFFDSKNDSINLALIYQNLAKAADLEGHLDSFVQFSKLALEVYQYYDYQPGVCEVLNNLGNAYIKLGNYQLAKKYLDDAMKLARVSGLKNSEGFILTNLGKLAFRQNKWSAAENFYKSSLLILEEVGNTHALEGVLWDLMGVYFHTNRFDLFLEAENDIKTIIQNTDEQNAVKKIEQIKQIYEIEKKDQLIKNQQLKLKIADNRFKGTIFITFLVFAFSIYFYQNRNKEYKTLKALFEANKALISSSIPNSSTHISEKVEKLSELYGKLLEVLNSQQVYKDSQVTLQTLTKILNSNESYLSEAINKIGGVNLNQLLNSYRVKAILKELHQSDLETISLKDLSLQNGFNSRSTFYRAFKSEVGMSPQQYLEFMNEQDS
jgi:AraC-like DNA-binding protein